MNLLTIISRNYRESGGKYKVLIVKLKSYPRDLIGKEFRINSIRRDTYKGVRFFIFYDEEDSIKLAAYLYLLHFAFGEKVINAYFGKGGKRAMRRVFRYLIDTFSFLESKKDLAFFLLRNKFPYGKKKRDSKVLKKELLSYLIEPYQYYLFSNLYNLSFFPPDLVIVKKRVGYYVNNSSIFFL